MSRGADWKNMLQLNVATGEKDPDNFQEMLLREKDEVPAAREAPVQKGDRRVCVPTHV